MSTLHIMFEEEEIPDLRRVLDRAMNAWEPKDQPRWLQELSDKIDRRLGLEVPPTRNMRPLNDASESAPSLSSGG